MPGVPVATPARRLAAYYFAYFAYAGVMVPYFALYLAALGCSATEIATVLAMPQVARIFAPAAWGWIADHSGARRSIVIFGGAALVAGYGTLFFVRDTAGIALVMLVMSVLSAGALPIVESIALGALGAGSGRYGPVRLWGSVSFIASVLLAGVWLDTAPAQALLVPIFVLAVAAFASAFALPETTLDAAPGAAPSLLAVLRQPEVAALLGACFCMVLAHGALYAFFTLHLERAGYAKSTIGMLWTLGVLAEILVFIWLPRLFKAFTLRTLLLTSFALAVVRFAATGWGVEWLAVLVFAQLLHAATFAVYHSASVAVIHRLFEGCLQARGQAIYTSLSYGLGGATGTLLAGWTWATLGPGATFGVSAGAAALGAVFVARGMRRG
ncbi:MAG TPA: MFS transporter [Burkholderiales bacterium]